MKPFSRKYTKAQEDEALRLHQVFRMGPSEISGIIGMKVSSVTHLLLNHKPPTEHIPYRLPHFDGWCFIYDNIEVGPYA